jgi:hypothetical protein
MWTFQRTDQLSLYPDWDLACLLLRPPATGGFWALEMWFAQIEMGWHMKYTLDERFVMMEEYRVVH